MKATTDQQLAPAPVKLEYLIRDVLPVLRAVAEGGAAFGDWSEQPDDQGIHVRMTLGDYRRAVRLRQELERA